VLSTVLMILVTIIGMSVLFAFFVNYAKDFQVGSGSAVRESLVIEDVWFNDDADQIEVWVYNVGKVDLKVTSVFIDDKRVSVGAGSDAEVSVGEHAKLNLPCSFDVGGTYDFKIVTARGSVYEGRYRWEA